jgi:hypothetical protein
MAYFSKIYLLRQFVSYRGMTYLFGNLRTRARKNRQLNFGVGPKILAFYIKETPSTIEF